MGSEMFASLDTSHYLVFHATAASAAAPAASCLGIAALLLHLPCDSGPFGVLLKAMSACWSSVGGIKLVCHSSLLSAILSQPALMSTDGGKSDVVAAATTPRTENVNLIYEYK